MNKKILGFGFVLVVLVLSAWFFGGSEKTLSKNLVAPAIETPGKNSAEPVLVRDSVTHKNTLKLSSEPVVPSVNQSVSTKNPPSSESSKRQETDFRNLLTSEEKLIYKSGDEENPGELYLNSLLVMPILSEDDAFNRSMEEFLSDQQNSTDAMDMAYAYTDIFEVYGEGLNDEIFDLQNFSCGHSVCVGSVLTGNSGDTWEDFLTRLRTNGGVIRVFTENPIPTGDDTIEHRFFFSTDPNLVGIMISEGG